MKKIALPFFIILFVQCTISSNNKWKELATIIGWQENNNLQQAILNMLSNDSIYFRESYQQKSLSCSKNMNIIGKQNTLLQVVNNKIDGTQRTKSTIGALILA